VVTFALLFSGMPIAFALGLSSLAFMALFMPSANLGEVAYKLFNGLDDFTLLTIPLFVLMVRRSARPARRRRVWLAQRLAVSHSRGLGIANVFACSVFAAMCGSSPATCSAIGSTGIPQLRARGYSKDWPPADRRRRHARILIPPASPSFSTASSRAVDQQAVPAGSAGHPAHGAVCRVGVIKFRIEHKQALAALGAGAQRAAILEDEHYSWRERFVPCRGCCRFCC